MNFVYVIGHVGEEEGIVAPIKIGASDDPLKRLRSLQTGNPRPLALHMTMRGYDALRLERSLHERLAPYRMSGEWFDVSPWDALGEIAKMAGVVGAAVLPHSCVERANERVARAAGKSNGSNRPEPKEDHGPGNETGQVARNRRWRAKNREHYNAYMRTYRRKK